MLGKLLDRFCFTTIFLFAAVLFILIGVFFPGKHGGPAIKDKEGNMIRSGPILPKTVGMWTRPDSPKVVTEKNIFDYMDGAGELYLGYRFDHLEVFEYTARTQEEIQVEIYFMKTSDDAFGLLSLDWGGEPVNLGLSSQKGASSLKKESDRLGWPKALYGEGLLRFRSDDIYARVMATKENPESRKAVLSIGRSIGQGGANMEAPRLMNEIPLSFLPHWTILKDRASYFRSHLVLNSLYYLSHENLFDLDLSSEGVTVPYEERGTSEGKLRIQFLRIDYPDQARAREALVRFHQAYLPEYPIPENSDLSAEVVNILSIEDGWLAYKKQRKSIVFLFECPDKKTAEALIDQIE